MVNTDKEDSATQSFYFWLLMTQTAGLSVSVNVPNSAVHYGALGYMVSLIILYIVIGVPLLYMELIIGQFTGLNCINVWKVRPFLSQFGYLIIFRQFTIMVYNHVVFAFILHYFFISFENPVPYYKCGRWATKDCDIIKTNYTINQDCLKTLRPEDYCDKIYVTFPEYQYWRTVTLQVNATGTMTVTWRVALPSAVACAALYLSCFKREKSLKYFLRAFTLYPKIGYLILMVGSMLQKGIVTKFQDALDLDWKMFFRYFNLSSLVIQVVYCQALGSGLAVNLGSSCPFRMPSYANAVVAAAAAAAFMVLGVCTTAMMGCPYAYRYGVSPSTVLTMPMTFAFERTPTMLQEYDYNNFWAIVVYSCHASLSLRTDVLIFFNILQMLAVKFKIVAKYPGITTICGVIMMFLITLPFLGPNMSNALTHQYRLCMKLISVFVVIVECIVFILWYGLDRFCEDVHFMQGIRPRAYLRAGWIISIILLIYSFTKETYSAVASTKFDLRYNPGFWFFSISVSSTVLTLVTRLLVSACKGRFRAEVRLGSAWRPRSELLQRSRAMFSAQAMTKEYLYRQFHLQAGITARQQRANRARRNTTVI